MTFVDVRKGEAIDGYKCTGQTLCGTWARFVLDNSLEWTEERRREWERRREEQQRQQQARLALKAEMALSLQERDLQYRELLATLTLEPEDRADLKRRGFTDLEIDLCKIKSVKRYQKLQKEFSHLLPGVSSDGKTLITDAGYLCPVRNADNLIVSCQVRLRGVTSGRYRWLSSRTKDNPQGQTPHVYGKGFAELPLSVHRPQGEPRGVALVEGVGTKPFKTSQLLNLVIVGAAGGQWASSPNLTKATLDQVSAELETREITIFPDAGDLVNPQVMKRWRNVCSLLDGWGWSIRIAWWGQVTKKQCDVDELFDISVINYITPSEFWSLAEEHRSDLQSPPQSDKEKYIGDWRWDNWLKRRKYTPDIILNQEQFKFPQIPDSNVIVAVKSGLGTGKTEALLKLILTSERGSHLIGYRNNLLFQTIKRGAKTDVVIYHLREDDGHALVADELSHQAYCLDSIHHLDGYFTGKDLYLDEACSVLLHAVCGGTLGEGQARAIRILTRALEVCNRVFLLDGNLNDTYVDFVANLAKNKRVIKVENQRKIAPHTIKFIEGINEDGEIKQRDRSPLIKFMLDPDVIPWIFCDSKERTQVLNEILTERGKTGYVLNSETAGEEWAKEFLSDPDKFIVERKPGFIIISPTAESGVSVIIKGYFTHKFSFFVGVQGTNSQHQAMFRLRDNTIPHYVFCPERSNVRDRSNPNDYSVKKFQETINDRILQSAILASQSSDNPVRVTEIIGNAIARQNDDWWEFSAQVGSLDNWEMDNLRKCLIYALEDAGHNIEVLQWDINVNIQQLEKATREKVQRQRALEIYAAVEFDSVEEARKKAKSSPRKETQRRIEKTLLLDRIPGIQDNDLWGDEFIYQCFVKYQEFISQQQRYWLVNNVEISQKRHESQWFYQATNQDFFSARVKRMSHDVIWALRELDIMQFVGKEYYKDSIEVINLVNALRQRKDIQLALRISHLKPETSNGKERLEIIGTLLNLIGLKNVALGQRFVGTTRFRFYTALPNIATDPQDEKGLDLSAARLAILDAVGRKFTEWMQSEKSIVNWEPIEQPETVSNIANETENITALTPESAAEKLRAVQSWAEVTLSQSEIDTAWLGLTLQEQKRLEQLYTQWSQTVEEQGCISMLVELLPQCDDSETVSELIRPINPNIVVEAVRSLTTEVRSKILGFCDGLRTLFKDQPDLILD